MVFAASRVGSEGRRRGDPSPVAVRGCTNVAHAASWNEDGCVGGNPPAYCALRVSVCASTATL
jgi:hypothetical protein